MRIIVVSDSHGDVDLLHDIVSRNRGNCDLVIHLGDNLKDINEVMRDFPMIAKLGVLGNCDFASMYLDARIEGTFSVEGKRIFYTHGHKYNVGFGIEYLVSNAKFNNCNIALYGHTHVAVCEECNGVLVINPGSISRPRDGSGGTYAIIDINDGKVYYSIEEVMR